MNITLVVAPDAHGSDAERGKHFHGTVMIAVGIIDPDAFVEVFLSIGENTEYESDGFVIHCETKVHRPEFILWKLDSVFRIGSSVCRDGDGGGDSFFQNSAMKI